MVDKRALFIDGLRHGWLRVSAEDLRELGIEEDISPFSYIDEHYAYLEEDVDAGTFLEAAEAAGWTIIRGYKSIDRAPVWFEGVKEEEESAGRSEAKDSGVNCYLCLSAGSDNFDPAEVPFDEERFGICILHGVALWRLGKSYLRFEMRGSSVAVKIEKG